MYTFIICFQCEGFTLLYLLFLSSPLPLSRSLSPHVCSHRLSFFSADRCENKYTQTRHTNMQRKIYTYILGRMGSIGLYKHSKTAILFFYRFVCSMIPFLSNRLYLTGTQCKRQQGKTTPTVHCRKEIVCTVHVCK